jgi:hypothetical protein
MGMYTEFHFNAELKQDTPQTVIATLAAMLANDEPKDFAPLFDHPLFQTMLWRFMLVSDSYYFPADTHSTCRYDDIANSRFLCIRCNLKNYDGEIEKFIDWIMPYVDETPGEFLGFYRHEEDVQPTLIYAPDSEVRE